MLSLVSLQQAGQLGPHVPTGSGQLGLQPGPSASADLLSNSPQLAPWLACLWEPLFLSASPGNAPERLEALVGRRSSLEGRKVVSAGRLKSKVLFQEGSDFGFFG